MPKQATPICLQEYSDELHLNQELEAIETELSQIRNFLSLSASQKRVFLAREADPRQAARNLIRSTARIYDLF